MASNFKKQIYANNATSSLAFSISNSSTTLSLVNGSSFPTPAEGQYFTVTLGSGSDIEIVEVHSRQGNSLLDCVRGAEGTIAKSFPAGTLAENRLTAGSIQDMSRLQDRLSPIFSLNDLDKPELLNNNSCLLKDTDDAGNPIVAMEYSGRWRFLTHPVVLVDQEVFDVGNQITSTILEYASSTNLQALYVTKGLVIQAVSGLNRGQARYVDSVSSTHLSWVTPFPYSFSYGDRVQVYQSASSAIAWLTAQISAVSGGQSSQQSMIQEEIYKTAYKSPVTVATTSNISLVGLQVVDGTQLQNGDRVLVKNQDSPSQNGIYIASSTGWARSIDANDNVKVRPNMVVPVIGGLVNADSVWMLDVSSPVTLGVTNLAFKNLNFAYAPLSSPTLVGVPSAPTAPIGTRSTQIATTEYVINQASAAAPQMNGQADPGVSTQWSRSDHIHPSDTSRAPVVSPSLLGSPTSTTPEQFSNSARIATTEFVQKSLGSNSGVALYSGATSILGPSDVGKVVLISYAVNAICVVYLPRISTLPSGVTITVRAETWGCLSINCLREANGDWVALDSKYALGSDQSYLYLMPQESVTLTLYKTSATGGYPTLSGRWYVTSGDVLSQPATAAICYFAVGSAPFGYLKANGQAVSRDTYARLYNAIGVTHGAGNGVSTFNVPDLRAEFIRGLDDGRGVDAGRVIGTSQHGQIQKHKHISGFGEATEPSLFGESYNRGFFGSNGGIDYDNYLYYTNDGSAYSGNSPNASGLIGDETRPRNIAMMACIKY